MKQKNTQRTLGRPAFKNNAERISLTLSEPARDYLFAQASLRGVSRTQVVEELIALARRQNGAAPESFLSGAE